MRLLPPRSFVFALLLVPTLAFAQRGGGRGRSDDNSGGQRQAPQRPLPSVRDLEDLNPATILIDKKKKIGLADDQVTQLKALEKTIKDRNKPLLAEYDSVRRKVRPPSSIDRGATMSAGEQQEMQQAMQGMRSIVQRMRAQRIADSEEALKLVADEGQKKKATDVLKDQDEDFDKILPGGRGDRTAEPPSD
jgi:hypothetical protein